MTPVLGRATLLLALAVGVAFAAPDETPTVDRSRPGYVVYKREGCNVCHGAGLEGTRMGPALLGAGRHWTRESFARYLAAPDSAAAVDERLRAQKAGYRMFEMPAFELEAEQLDALANLLELRVR